MASVYMSHPAGAHDLYVLLKGFITASVRQLLLRSCGQVVPRACSGLYGPTACLFQFGAGVEGV
jgi:hypothetical protein